MISNEIDKISDPKSSAVLSILDAGSSLGYISNYIADTRGHNVKGIDFDAMNNYIANLISLNIGSGAKFKTEVVSKGLINEMLPEFDVMFYLSILHHVNKEFRFDTGDGTP